VWATNDTTVDRDNDALDCSLQTRRKSLERGWLVGWCSHGIMDIVTAFWEDVWNAHEPDAVDRFVADDVVIEAGGEEIAGKDNIKNWVKQFLDHVNDLHVDNIETFQSEDGTRVTSRWVLTGTNNGILGTEPNGKPIAMTGTAVWTVDEGKLQRGWVEQASFELYHWLLAK
jgi:steroid delta-isomerase-like uncharacterized protein